MVKHLGSGDAGSAGAPWLALGRGWGGILGGADELEAAACQGLLVFGKCGLVGTPRLGGDLLMFTQSGEARGAPVNEVLGEWEACVTTADALVLALLKIGLA